MNTGLISGEPIATYHGCEAISKSKLDDFETRPAFFKRKHVDKAIPHDEADAFTFGEAFHCLVLEGVKRFESRFYIGAKHDRRTITGKMAYAAMMEDAAGRQIISDEEFSRAKRMADAVLSNPMAAELLTSPDVLPEVTFRTPVLAHGRFAVQCRADAYNRAGCAASHGRTYCADIKTIADLDQFAKHFHEFRYYRQAPFYQRVIATVSKLHDYVRPAEAFYFVAVEKDEPYGCTVFECDPMSVSLGLKEIDSLLSKLAECYASNIWPNAPMHAYATLPSWFLERKAA